MNSEKYQEIFAHIIQNDIDKALSLFTECVNDIASTKNIVRTILKDKTENDTAEDSITL